MKNPRQAFTLFELILVCAILAVVAAIAAPSLDSMQGSFRVTAAADTIRSAWAEARAHAMNEGRAYRFSIIPNKGNFRLAPDSPEFWAGSGGDGAAFVQEDALPRGVRFLPGAGSAGGPLEGGNDTILPPGTVDPSAWSNPVVFFPNGTAREDVEIVLRGQGCRPLLVRLRGLTGAVTTRWLND